MNSGKILIIHNIITPYRVDLFNFLQIKYKDRLNVLFLNSSEENRVWHKENLQMKFKHEILKSFVLKIPGKTLFQFHLNPGFLKILERYNPDKVIYFGFGGISLFQTMYWCHKNQKKLILWSGTVELNPAYDHNLRRAIFIPLLKPFLQNYVNSFIAYGTKAKEYLVKQLNIPAKKIELFYNTVDTAKYSQASPIPAKVKQIQNKFKNKKIILFSGQLIERKGITQLIKAFQQTSDKDSILLIAGNGELQKMVMANIAENIQYIGNFTSQDMPALYKIAKILIVPSLSESWGLVINEALACGIPVITTKYVGAATDLIKHQFNGIILKDLQPQTINLSIKFILDNHSKICKNVQSSKAKFTFSENYNNNKILKEL